MNRRRVGLLQLDSGFAGDMFLGALAGAGADFEAMRRAVQQATGQRADLRRSTVKRGALEAVKVDVVIDGHPLHHDPGHGDAHHGTAWSAIDGSLARAGLPESIAAGARAVFRRLAEAEARVHGATLDTVHFHEVGGLDAVADIVGSVAGLESLQLDALRHGSVNGGGGTVDTAHGRLPLPAPAALALMEGREVTVHTSGGELLTPTGAALLAECARPQEAGITLRPTGVGLGAGSRDIPGLPNVARLVVGEVNELTASETVGVVEAGLDDCTPEDLGFVLRRFMEDGALDATVTPLVMKKSRPGHLLRLLVPAADVEAWAVRVTEETSSLGARWRLEPRCVLPRRTDTVDLPEGRFRVKVAEGKAGERPHVEQDDLERAARETGKPIVLLRRLVERAWETRQ